MSVPSDPLCTSIYGVLAGTRSLRFGLWLLQDRGRQHEVGVTSQVATRRINCRRAAVYLCVRVIAPGVHGAIAHSVNPGEGEMHLNAEYTSRKRELITRREKVPGSTALTKTKCIATEMHRALVASVVQRRTRQQNRKM